MSYASRLLERKEYEQKLKQSKQEIEDFQALSNVGTWTINFPARKVIWSNEMMKIYQLPPNSPSPTIEEYLNKYTFKGDLAVFSQALELTKKQEVVEFKIRAINDKQEIFYAIIKAKALKSPSGKWIGGQGTMMELIEEKYLKNLTDFKNEEENKNTIT